MISKQYHFQGLPIAVETKRGSTRHWYDPHNNTSGSTLMHHDYGYVKNTLGTDGDDVDVYIGPNPNSTRVFIITQAKAPEFTEVDEQKCMLGFDSPEHAKHAYLQHYNNPKFFMKMKELSIDDFKDKLNTNKGRLIKNMTDDVSKALSAAIAAFIKRETETEGRYAARVAHDQPSVGSNVEFRPGEPPPVPVRRINYYPPMFSTAPVKESK